MSQFSNLVRTGKLNHGVRVIKTRTGAIAKAGWPGRKLQVRGKNPAKAVKRLKALGLQFVWAHPRDGMSLFFSEGAFASCEPGRHSAFGGAVVSRAKPSPG